ncbi:branched-chain amino acid aminotransferase [Membranihabitans maritimus]|uniref:branched-chain amino acid aminotransferase n=1 Tax=Membranihabitans maritimus TaxID=2904244 RepID=UPI001F009BF5|nr:branched-chain amino acid aminotransferase [Membranihabitans maritimus]
MENAFNISVKKSQVDNTQRYDFTNIQFGTNPTDHIFTAEYKDGIWNNLQIEPFHNLTLSPLALCFHYGQAVFEGLKAYRCTNGNVNVFRIDRHADRFNLSLKRMSMPEVPKELFISAILHLIETDRSWVPSDLDSSLYLRPIAIATEPRIGVKISDEYLFVVMAMPMGQYFSKNLKVKVETQYIRCATGGTGSAKCGGNYGGAFYPTAKANKEGFDQVLWTDAQEHLYIEESGMMNIMFVIDGILITPPLSGTILDGVTRDSLITIAKDMGIAVEERKISHKELESALQTGKKVEAFGVGTAAVISPIESVSIGAKTYKVKISEKGIPFRLKEELKSIRSGRKPDIYGWNTIIHSV